MYRPGVRMILGHEIVAESPPETYASKATEALQKAVKGLGKRWKFEAPTVIIAPVPGQKKVIAGINTHRAPIHFDAPRMIAPNSAISKEHKITEAYFATGQDLDDFGTERSDQGTLKALRAKAEDKHLAALGLELKGLRGEARHYLLSDDGRAGTLAYGQILWKPGREKAGGAARTWLRRYAEGEAARLVGVSYAEVGAEEPLLLLDSSPEAVMAHEKLAREAVMALQDTPARWTWALVC